MERESFTSLPIAKLLNDSFVSIKVDKEERSDVDRVYMTYVQVSSNASHHVSSVSSQHDRQHVASHRTSSVVTLH